jgi:hypothetical protein
MLRKIKLLKNEKSYKDQISRMILIIFRSSALLNGGFRFKLAPDICFFKVYFSFKKHFSNLFKVGSII